MNTKLKINRYFTIEMLGLRLWFSLLLIETFQVILTVQKLLASFNSKRFMRFIPFDSYHSLKFNFVMLSRKEHTISKMKRNWALFLFKAYKHKMEFYALCMCLGAIHLLSLSFSLFIQLIAIICVYKLNFLSKSSY